MTVDYFAYFEDLVSPHDPLGVAITAFARSVGVEPVFVPHGTPFIGMRTQVKLSPISRKAVEEFRARFKPARDVDIDFL
jgi:hypothetical protein